MRSNKGFTLLEVILVMLLLGILAYTIIPDYKATLEHTKSEVDQDNRIFLNQAVRSYMLDTGKFPCKLEDLIAMPMDTENWQGPYLDKIPDYPLDPRLNYEIDPHGKVIVQ
ncbi:type II secretion system GspH family protein [Dehalobacter sp. DCM]|uniref:type II secretion system protein n=1 Tax=Dehalobacter sp. DCM TaxID=2907827 RepID=UPI003081EE34|nr:type II secretion system GspH family protein [Dehalobacter sp. DCM]